MSPDFLIADLWNELNGLFQKKMFKVTHLSNMDEKALHSHTAEEKYKKRFIGVLLFGIFSVGIFWCTFAARWNSF